MTGLVVDVPPWYRLGLVPVLGLLRGRLLGCIVMVVDVVAVEAVCCVFFRVLCCVAQWCVLRGVVFAALESLHTTPIARVVAFAHHSRNDRHG